VFAKARAALEAAAVGTAVVLCDVAGTGPMVTTRNVAALRRLNFGMRALADVPTVDGMAREIARYDAADAAAVSKEIRNLAGHDALLDQLLAVYADALADGPLPGTDVDAELRATADYLRRLSPKLYERDLLRIALGRLLRVPVAGAWLRRRALREAPTHWLPEILRAMDGH
jgi:hypothetical protein